MHPLYLASMVVTWVMLIVLGGLLCVLFRRIDNAYRRGNLTVTSLPAGSTIPAVEITTEQGLQLLPAPPPGPWLLAFVNTECPDCTMLIQHLAAGANRGLPVRLVIMAGATVPPATATSDDIEVFTAGHPPDLRRDFGVTVVPTLYSLRGNHIVMGAVASDPNEIARIVDAVLLTAV